MNDDRHHPPDPDAPEGHEHHGVVETLREELHEAVEHVPQPVRWTVGKLVRVALLSFVILLVVLVASGLLYLANRTELVARELTLVLNHTLAQHSDLELTLQDVKGNPLTGFRVIEPRVRFRSDGAPVLEAHELRLAYSALGLLRGGRGPIEITVDRAIVHLDGGAGGGWRIPAWRSNGPSRPAGAGLVFGLTLRDARLIAPRPLGLVGGIEMRVAGNTGAKTHIEVAKLRWLQGPWHSRLDQLAAELDTDGDSVRVRVRELRTGDIALRLRGAWKNGSDVRIVHADVDRVRWRWLAEVFDNDEFDVPGDGKVHVDATGGKAWRGGFSADVSWDSLAIVGRGQFGWDGRKLSLDSLVASSLAGDFRGQLRWSKQGWTIAADAHNADPSHWHALRIDGWPAGKLNGHLTYVLDSRGRVNTSRLDCALVGSQWTGWNVDSARVRVDFPGVADDSFRVEGFRRGGRFLLAATVNKAGWDGPYSIDEFPLDEWPDGRASGLRGMLTHGEGRVSNRAGQLFVTGDLEGRGTDWSAAHFAHWRLAGVDGRLLPTPDMTARVETHDGFFVGVHLDSADAAMHLGDQTVAFSPLHAIAGDTLFTATGDASWSGATWNVRMNSATAASSQFAWTAEPPLVFSGDPSGTVFERVVANDRAAHLEARGRWAAPGGAYDFSMDGRGLDLGRLGMPLDWGLSGTGDARLAVSGRSGDPHWTFDGRASRPGFDGHRCDTLSLALAGQQHQLEVRDLLFGLDGGTARAHGEVRDAPRAWPDSITATAVVRWLQDAGAWSGALDAHRLPVSHLGSLAPAAEGWGGTLEGTLTLSGSPPRPEFDVKGRADDFGWRDYRAQRVELQAGYDGGALDVSQALITMQDVVSTVHGRMPLTLALGHVPRVPDAAMSWSIEVPQGDLKLLPALVPLVQSARGRFDLTATVAGTAQHPHVEGRAHIRDGLVRPAGREEILEGVYADLHFDEAGIQLDSLTAHQGRTGRVWSKGVARMNGFTVKDYKFDLRMRDFASSQEGLYALLFDGDFSVMNGPPVLGQPLPQVVGDVQVKRGVIEFDFANQSEVQKRAATTEPLYWTYKIHLGASSNLRWRPPDGDMEFDADLDLEQTPDSLLIYGEMHLVKGHYFFLSNRFNVTQADLTFDNQKGVDPTLDIIAETRLKPSRGELAQGGSFSGSSQAPENIYARLTGRSSSPVIELTSSSGWDQKQILGELTYGRFTGEGVSPTDPVQNYLTRQISNQLSSELAKLFNDGINQWEVERDQGELFNGGGAIVMSVGGDINNRTSWLYRQRIPGLDRPNTTTGISSSLFDRDVEVEYRLNRFIYATTELTQHRVSQVVAGQNNTEFNVNLKARWEY
jgi:hypothetical protein